MQEVVAVEPVDRVDEREAVLRALGHRHRDRAVQLDDRRGRELEQPAVEEGDLAPVGLGLGVQGGDRGLELVRAGHAQRERPLERGAALLDLAVVPEARSWSSSSTSRPSWLTRASRRASWSSSERVQAVHLRLVGHQRREQEARAGSPPRRARGARAARSLR